MKRFFVLFLIIILSLPAISQQEQKDIPVKKNKHFFGLGVSSTSGMGFTYRLWHHDKIGIHISALPYVNGISKKVFVCSSVSPLLVLREVDNTKFYIFNSYQFLYKEKHYEWEWDNFTQKTSNLSIGLGVGFQFTQDHFSIAMQLGYGGYAINTDTPSFFPAGGAFMFYNF